MPKRAPALTDRQVKARSKKVGFHSVGGTGSEGLALQVKNEQSASWVLRVVIHGKRRDIGLGSYPLVSLAMARSAAMDMKRKILEGADPVAERKSARSRRQAERVESVTIRKVAADYVDKKGKDFKGKDVAKRIGKLQNQLEAYVFPVIGSMLPADVQLAHVKEILKPIWEKKTDTANRVRLHVEGILDLATVEGLRKDANPARWKGYLEKVLPKPSNVRKARNRAALPVDDMPGFFASLRERDGVSARALEFTILTAARPGEARAARWDQIDLDAKTWTIDGGEMKEGKTHVVPLTDAAIKLIKSMPQLGETIFHGPRSPQISDVSVSKMAKSIGGDITVHGFRSTFKDWCRIHTAYDDEVSELALAHVGTDRTRAAYARDSLLDKRRQLMAEWENYCSRGEVPQGAKVVNIGGRR
ncbi:tyrosine-type recombinase/integrase [Microbulbifer magnicolonia]|uniref:tyrosine-type recombinase/integrase n=1 Tax=Microbulbifer magnicolonia TaxID=3109744 RepID=UPI002B4156AA|nr:integrase arm-type DNA-binding domain-containing protein [Microbulbifer sp. GG15]